MDTKNNTAGVPEGWKPVPVTATKHMILAGMPFFVGQREAARKAWNAYAAMLAAAPAPTQQPEQDKLPNGCPITTCFYGDCPPCMKGEFPGAAPAQEAEDYQIREIGESDWQSVSRERMESVRDDPHMDYRVVQRHAFLASAEAKPVAAHGFWTIADVKAAIERAQGFPGWDRLPQPLRASIDEADWILAKVEAKPVAQTAEPVAWMVEFKRAGSMTEDRAIYWYYDAIPNGFLPPMGNPVPLYAAPAAPVEVLTDERAKFETWAIKAAPKHSITRKDNGEYEDYPTHCAWAGYRAALATHSGAEVPSDLSKRLRQRADSAYRFVTVDQADLRAACDALDAALKSAAAPIAASAANEEKGQK